MLHYDFTADLFDINDSIIYIEKISGSFRLRSNSGVYSSSISDCTAHNVAYCDSENGTPQDGFSLRFLPSIVTNAAI